MQKGERIVLKDQSACTGCGACIAACPKDAIRKITVGYDAWIPEIDINSCTACGVCKRVCEASPVKDTVPPKAYIAYNRDHATRLRSASGGAFSALAVAALSRGVMVFGAEMSFEDGKAIVEHRGVEQIDDLPRILGSKYVQSDCSRAYEQVKCALLKGNEVLFSGCSCQIDGLKKYLGKTDQTKLYTVDLICHGVPSVDLFNDYLRFLGKKYQGKICGFSFRAKEKGLIAYEATVDLITEKGNNRRIKIPYRKSGYYAMFLGAENYREACYHCPYATVNKPADITVGDYFEAQKDYPDLFKGETAIDAKDGISSVIVRTQKGCRLVEEASTHLYLFPVDAEKVCLSHGNLQKPSAHSYKRVMLLPLYKRFGHSAIECFYMIREKIVFLPRMLLHRIRGK